MTTSKLDQRFCALPFSQMVLHPDGHIAPCCNLDNYVLGNINDQSLLEIWNGDPIQRLREQFLLKTPTVCKECMNTFACHNDKAILNDTVERKGFQTRPPARLHMRLNGQCNLECTMCDIWQQPNGRYTDQNFWQSARRELFPYLKHLEVLGGEPFIQKDTFRLINEVQKVNPNCQWSFITNGNYKVTPKLLTQLDPLNLNCIQLSIDSLEPQQYVKIRKRGNLKKVLETFTSLLQFREYRAAKGTPFHLVVSKCVQKNSWLDISDFFDFAIQNNVELLFQYVHTPHSSSLNSESDKIRQHCKNEIANMISSQPKTHHMKFFKDLAPVFLGLKSC
jgi:radical SAM protein with 4Fe4S-binding SPASM domain